MKAIRRFRPLLAALALLLSPGSLAPWLQLGHACPTLPAATGHAMAMEGHGQHAGHQSPSQDSRVPHPCDCIGTCQYLVASELPRAVVVPAPVLVAAPRSHFLAGATPDLLPPEELLPPATAPPIAA